MRWLGGFLIAVALLAQPAIAQRLLSPSQFRDAVVALMRETAPEVQVRVTGDLSLQVQRPDRDEGDEMTVNLDRGYSEYTYSPADLEAIAAQWARFASQEPEHAQMPERIVVVLRPYEQVEAYATAIAGAKDGEGGQLVWRPFAGDLVEVMVFDSAETVQYTTDTSLTEINVTPDQAWALTRRNLPTRLGPIETEMLAEGLELITGGNGLAPSVLTDPSWCAAPGSDQFAYLVVDRAAYLRADLRTDGAPMMRSLRDEMVRAGETLSGTVLVCAGGRLQAETH